MNIVVVVVAKTLVKNPGPNHQATLAIASVNVKDVMMTGEG